MHITTVRFEKLFAKLHLIRLLPVPSVDVRAVWTVGDDPARVAFAEFRHDKSLVTTNKDFEDETQNDVLINSREKKRNVGREKKYYSSSYAFRLSFDLLYVCVGIRTLSYLDCPTTSTLACALFRAVDVASQ